MSNVIQMHSEPTSAREMVAAEVRAELARKRQNSNSLPKFIGKSQRYWYERINARLAFSVDDLAALSTFLQVPMSNFIPSIIAPDPTAPETQNSPASEETGLNEVPPTGVEPATYGTNVRRFPIERARPAAAESVTLAPVTAITGERVA